MSFGKFTRQEIIDLISGSWSPYWGGTGESGTPGGPLNSIQFNSASIFSGSSTFTYDTNTNGLYYTGSFFISGAISASFGANTIGFFGTSSWAVSSSRATTSSFAVSASYTISASYALSSSFAVSASRAVTASYITSSNVFGPYGSNSILSASYAANAGTSANVNGIDEYMSRFNGSNAVETASFINRRNLNSFQTIDLDATAYPSGPNNTPSNQSFIVGQQNVHSSSLKATSIGDASKHGSTVSSLTTNYGTSVSHDYDVAMNYINSTSPRIQFKGYTDNVVDGTSAFFNMLNGSIFTGESIDLYSIAQSGSATLLIYDHTVNKLIEPSRGFTYNLITCTPKVGGAITCWGIRFNGSLKYYDGSAVSTSDDSLFSVFLINSLNESYSNYKANFTTGINNSTYGVANQANGYLTTAIGIANQSNGIGSIVIGNPLVTGSGGNVAHGINNGVWSQAGAALGAYNISGKSYWSNQIDHATITDTSPSYDGNYSRFPAMENLDLYNFLDVESFDSPLERKSFPVIVIIPSQNYCGLVEIFAYKSDNNIYCTSILPTGSSVTGDPHYAQIILSDNSIWYNDINRETRHPYGSNTRPYATTAIGYNNAADGTAAFAGGMYSSARGQSAFAFGRFVDAQEHNAIAFGTNIINRESSSFSVGYYPDITGSGVDTSVPHLHVRSGFVAVNTSALPAGGFTGLRVVPDLWVDNNVYIQNDLLVTGSTYLGDVNLTDSTYILGSLYVDNFARVTGRTQITGSLIVSNSLNVIGTNIVSGNLFVTGSQRNIGTFTNTGSFNISGSVNINGDITVTGLQTIGGNIFLGNQLSDVIRMTGSVNITGSLIANNSYLTGSLTGSFIGTGSGNFDGRFIGIYTGSINPGVSFFGTASWASQVLTASYVTSSNVFGPYAANSILSSSYSVTSSYSVSSSYSISSSYAVSSSFSLLTSNILGGATNYITVWNSATSLSSSAATDNGSLFSINRNTEVTGTLAINVPSATNQNQPAMQVNNNGLFIIGSSSVIPTAVPGGIYFDGTDFYLGFV
jgi:hypothetical protein